jgi:exopolysaccharide biosynthesis WecB/TagA/CpsF family protein
MTFTTTLPGASKNGSPRSKNTWPAKYDLFGVQVSATNYQEMVDATTRAARRRESAVVSLHAAHAIVQSSRDPALREKVNRFDAIAPDGQPVRWALNHLHRTHLPDRVYGPELMLQICKRAALESIPIYLYGSTPRVIQLLRQKLPARFPGLLIAGAESPPFRPLTPEEDAEVVRRINASGAGIVFIGLGCPKQDHFAADHADRIRAVQICVGAAFEFHAGTKPMAPKWMQRHGLEWLYRLASEPRRLWWRYLHSNSVFLGKWVLASMGLCRTTLTKRQVGLRSAAANAKRPALDSSSFQTWVVLPAYNEESSLPPLLNAINDALQTSDIPYGVIVVDDGSQDATAHVAREASRNMPVELIAHEKNQGLAAAMRTGLCAALERCGPDDVIVTMDSDNTHPPALIPHMLELLEEDRDVVIASRFQPGARVVGVPPLRQLYSVAARWLFQMLFPIRGVRDYTCGYRAYRAAALMDAFSWYGDSLISETGFSCMADLLLKLRRLPLAMGEVPLELRYDRRGSDSKMKVLRTIRQTMLLMLRRRLGRYG